MSGMNSALSVSSVPGAPREVDARITGRHPPAFAVDAGAKTMGIGMGQCVAGVALAQVPGQLDMQGETMPGQGRRQLAHPVVDDFLAGGEVHGGPGGTDAIRAYVRHPRKRTPRDGRGVRCRKGAKTYLIFASL